MTANLILTVFHLAQSHKPYNIFRKISIYGHVEYRYFRNNIMQNARKNDIQTNISHSKKMFRICFQCFNVMRKLYREENIYISIGICLV